MPVAMGRPAAKGRGGLHTREIDHYINEVVDNPTVFVVPSEKLAGQMLTVTKQLYDLAVTCAPRADEEVLGPLPELIVDGFDDDQVWEELQLRNGALLEWLEAGVDSLVQANKRSGGGVKVFSEFAGKGKQSKAAMVESEEEEEEEEEEEDMGSEYDEEDVDDDMDMGEGGEEEDDDEGEGMGPEGRAVKAGKPRETDTSGRSAPKRRGPTSQVDDQFFKLSEMADFLDKMDKIESTTSRGRKVAAGDSGDDDDDDENENDEDIDLFRDPDDLSESEEEDDYEEEDDAANEDAQVNRKTGGGIRYEDFYGKDTDGERDDGGEDGEDDDDDEMEEDEMEEDEEDSGDEVQKDLFAEGSDEEEAGGDTAFSKKQARLKRTIEDLEEKNTAAKPWQLSGEASAKHRGVNSLLEEDVEFETTMRAAPEITEEVTLSLEDMIKQRIKDQAFDDVERKAEAPTHTFSRREVELDHEKSKKGLAEVYEDEYLRQVKGVGANQKNEALEKQHKEIGELFQQLCAKLDALSNFHFTPARPKEDLEIVVNAPAISMEEVLPIAVSTHTQLAPEEVLAKGRREKKGDTELTDADRHYARKAKKSLKRHRRQDRERHQKAVEKANPGMGNKHSKKSALASIERGEVKGASVIKESADTRHLKSSTAFFAKLQDDVRKDIKGGKAAAGDAKPKNSKASSLKL